MAGKKTKHGSVKRFGSRYGRTLKNKRGAVEALQKKEYVCPRCRYQKVRQVATGIWSCDKCSATFTSKAFTISKLPSVKSDENERRRS